MAQAKSNGKGQELMTKGKGNRTGKRKGELKRKGKGKRQQES